MGTALMLLPIFSFAQNPERSIAILDLTEVNEETNDSRLFSVIHMVKVTGVPFIVTNNADEAMSYAMIMCSSRIKNSTFSEAETTDLTTYVQDGGTLFAPRIENEDFFPLFGLASSESNFSRYEIHWNENLSDAALRWIDEPEEWVVSLGRSTYPEIYKTLGYTPTSAKTLAYFEDGTSAVTVNNFGLGQTLTIGLSWKEVILRNQINRDYEAQRISSNGFEPTSDVFSLLVRGVFAQYQPYTVWKNTSPGNSKASLMITHDVDSKSGMDTLASFVDYEAAHQIEATYNITLRYFRDSLMSDFYLNRQSTLDYIKNHGQAFGAHSVGHFFDFADEDIFPIGSGGNTVANYNPFNDGYETMGGTVYAECEIPKNVLEQDINIDIRTFRAGHLAYPKFLIDVLDDLGYEYNSTNSASDVLTNFPYLTKKGRSFSGETSTIFEIPVTISDVFHADPISLDNYLDKANIWTDVTLKNRANGSPVTLLIHPNRNFKLEGMKNYLSQLPSDIHKMEMSAFGDFWKAREAFEFESKLVDNDLTVVIPASQDLEDNISFIVNHGQLLSSILVMDDQGQPLDFIQESWEGNDVILYWQDVVVSNLPQPLKADIALKVFPNPTSQFLNIAFNLPKKTTIKVDLYDLHGKRVMNLFEQQNIIGHQQMRKEISNNSVAVGIYFVVVRAENGDVWREKVVVF